MQVIIEPWVKDTSWLTDEWRMSHEIKFCEKFWSRGFFLAIGEAMKVCGFIMMFIVIGRSKYLLSNKVYFTFDCLPFKINDVSFYQIPQFNL